MADEKDVKKEKKPEEEIIPESKSSFSPKLFIIGLPLFVIQLIVVYFVTANILMDKMAPMEEGPVDDIVEASYDDETEEPEEDAEDVPPEEIGKYIFSIEDLIVNPANTSGNQLLLSSLTFDVATEENKKELEKKGFIVKDLIITIISSKSVEQLSNNNYKDSLRVEISENIEKNLPNMKINKVYFNKYILN